MDLQSWHEVTNPELERHVDGVDHIIPVLLGDLAKGCYFWRKPSDFLFFGYA
jgi:hypothetical protein